MRTAAWLLAMIIAPVVVALLAAAPAAAQDADAATKLKAAYLLNFVKATTWPAKTFPNEQAPIKVVVIGDDAFAGVLRALTARQIVGGRSISVTSVPPDASAIIEALGDARVAYAGRGIGGQVDQLLAATRDAPILMVGDVPDFARHGGMIGLDIDGGRVVFDAHLGAIRRSKLEVSSKVLRLARRVHGRDDR